MKNVIASDGFFDKGKILSHLNGSFISPLNEKVISFFDDDLMNSLAAPINEDRIDEAINIVDEINKKIKKDMRKLNKNLLRLCALRFVSVFYEAEFDNRCGEMPIDDAMEVFSQKEAEELARLEDIGIKERSIMAVLESIDENLIHDLSCILCHYSGGYHDSEFLKIIQSEDSNIDENIECAISEIINNKGIEIESGYFDFSDEAYDTVTDSLEPYNIREGRPERRALLLDIPEIGSFNLFAVERFGKDTPVISTTGLAHSIMSKTGYDFQDSVDVIKKSFDDIYDQGFLLTYEDIIDEGEDGRSLKRYEFVKEKLSERMAKKRSELEKKEREDQILAERKEREDQRQRELEEIYARAYQQEMERLNRASAQTRLAARETTRYEVPDFASRAPLPLTAPTTSFETTSHSDRPDNDEREIPIPLVPEGPSRARERIQKARSEMDNLYQRSAERKDRPSKKRFQERGRSSSHDF